MRREKAGTNRHKCRLTWHSQTCRRQKLQKLPPRNLISPFERNSVLQHSWVCFVLPKYIFSKKDACYHRFRAPPPSPSKQQLWFSPPCCTHSPASPPAQGPPSQPPPATKLKFFDWSPDFYFAHLHHGREVVVATLRRKIFLFPAGGKFLFIGQPTIPMKSAPQLENVTWTALLLDQLVNCLFPSFKPHPRLVHQNLFAILQTNRHLPALGKRVLLHPNNCLLASLRLHFPECELVQCSHVKLFSAWSQCSLCLCTAAQNMALPGNAQSLSSENLLCFQYIICLFLGLHFFCI